MKKGFTLIELLAVIVILAVVALIAFPVITGIIEKTKKSAALRSIEGYVEAANNASVLYDLDNNKGINVTEVKHTFTSSSDTTEFSKIKAKGTLPTYSYLDFDIKTKAVKEGHFCINGYSVLYSGGKAQSSETNYCEGDNAGEVIIIPKDEGNSCINAQAASDRPIFKYEATDEGDDYIYECKGGEWSRHSKAGYRWDGKIYMSGVYDADHFTTTWIKSSSVSNGTNSMSFGNSSINYSVTWRDASPYSASNSIEAVMDKGIKIERPGKIQFMGRVTASANTPVTGRVGLKTSRSVGTNVSTLTDEVVAGNINSTNNTTVTLTIPSEYVGQTLYVGVNVGLRYLINTNTSSASGSFAISEIQIIYD